MTQRTLICTFGFAKQKVLAAMRNIAYNRLVIVAGSDVLDREELRDLLVLESKGGGSARTVSVDPFDFAECLAVVDEEIRNALREGDVVVNISGGTKVLGDAAILAAFQNGVEAYHCDASVVRLPVLRGVRFEDAFTRSDLAVLEGLEDGDTVKDLAERISGLGITDSTLRKCLRDLNRLGVLQATLVKGEAKLFRTAGHRSELHATWTARASEK